MSRDMNNDIKRMFFVPAPQRKDDFIRAHREQFNYNKSNTLNMLLCQVEYISKSVWVLSIIVFILGVGILDISLRQRIEIVAALMPFVSGIAVYDTFRSRRYGMYEMEWASKYSLRQILFSRIIVIGIVHIALTLSLASFIRSDEMGFVNICMVITIPYLTSSIICLEFERTTFGRNNPFVCLMVSAFISVCIKLMQIKIQPLFWLQNNYMIIVLIALAFIECYEFKKIYHLEEYGWN